MKEHKIVFLFSGQGSQYFGMGQKLYENNQIFRKSLKKSDIIIQKHLKKSLIEELYGERRGNFDDILITHPGIVAIEIAMYAVLKSMDIIPDYVCGTSLGEFAAGVVSEIWTEQNAIKAAIEQAQSIIKKGINGGMLAVMDQEKKLTPDRYLKYNLFWASNNFEGHYTLSGLTEDIDAFQLELIKHKISFVQLPVKVPFHSPLIKESLESLDSYIDKKQISNEKCKFISGILGEEISCVPENYFEDVVSIRTNFSKTIRYIENKGPCLYIDLGASGTSTTFVRYNLDSLSKSDTFQIMTPFKRELQQLDKLKLMFTKS